MDIKDRIVKETNEEHALIKFYLDVTDEVKQLIGDVIKQAKIEIDECCDWEYIEEEKYILRKAEDMLNWVNIYLKENIIYLNEIDIYITFLNGETIKFWNSDQGGIERV